MYSQYSKQFGESAHISNRFRQLIKDHNMSQKAFCEKTGISTGHLSKVLTGNAIPSGAMLISIAKTGFDVNYILSGSSASEVLADREAEIEKLKVIVDELRSIIHFNLKDK